jgi:hypothetical protein
MRPMALPSRVAGVKEKERQRAREREREREREVVDSCRTHRGLATPLSRFHLT